MNSNIRYPEVTVTLMGEDGNAFNLLGITMRALRRHRVPEEEVREFYEEATAGDYTHLLTTISRWVVV